MIVIRVQEQDNNANGYLVCLFLVASRLKQEEFTSDIIQVVLIKIVNVQEMVFIDKSNSGSMLVNFSKWYHISTHSIIHTRWWFHK